jgi:thioredoxin 1
METELTDDNFKKEVLESKITCLVDFWAPWCMPCHMISPHIKEIEKEYDGRLKVCKLNVDAAHTTATIYNISSIPALLVFRNGEVVDTVIGVISKKEIENMIKAYI